MTEASDGRLAGRVAIVTGAGRGIGRTLALALAEAGASVVVAARRAETLDEVVAEIEQAGGRATSVPTDVTDARAVEALAQAAVSRYGGLDVMVNNAGTLINASIVDTDVEELDRLMATNVRGTFLGVQAALRVMGRGGSVINIASTFGNTPVRGYGAYCASKAAILQLTRVAALESARAGIRVNAIAPGFVATDFNTEAMADPTTRSAIEKRVPLGRVIDPDELVPLTLYLATDDSAYCTGSVFTIDGGFAL